MKYFSTRNSSLRVNFREAVISGLSNDGGLYLPEYFPVLEKNYINNLKEFKLEEIAFRISGMFVQNEIEPNELQELIYDAINFTAPLIEIDKDDYLLELFRGPTLAFKDFGARFMARIMGYFVKKYYSTELNILVATSGDTGSAVASGFYNVPGINVFILYPKGKVSNNQELQLTTFGKNIYALEIEGTFDDCQTIVKKAFTDEDLKKKINITSANSINISRLIPQSFYYFEAVRNTKRQNKKLVFSVPSGNLGNLTGGIFAKKMGLPIDRFIAATNLNDVFAKFIKTGDYKPSRSVQTISNAMDVGSPSNYERIKEIFQNNFPEIVKEISSYSFDDETTLKTILEVYKQKQYLLDPHGAVGYLAKEYDLHLTKDENIYITLLTAHPAKFIDVINKLGISIEIPSELKLLDGKEKYKISLPNDYFTFRELILKNDKKL